MRIVQRYGNRGIMKQKVGLNVQSIKEKIQQQERNIRGEKKKYLMSRVQNKKKTTIVELKGSSVP